MNLKGRVIYSSGGNYRVLVNKKIYSAKPRGYFRKDGTRILVGDIVELKIEEGINEINSIEKLYKRKNEFIRPNISNIDHAIIISSLVEPKLDTLLIDKFITIFQTNKIEPILVFTKYDILKNEKTIIMNKIFEYKNAGYKVLVKHIDDLNKLETYTKNKFSVITGQTGVGKTTILNYFKKDLNLETQKISKRLGRGKHTTRHFEAFEIFSRTYLVDTPGFSSLQLDDLTLEDISKNFFNLQKLSQKCKFNNCIHKKEIGCNVRNNISKEKFHNYNKIIDEITNKIERY